VGLVNLTQIFVPVRFQCTKIETHLNLATSGQICFYLNNFILILFLLYSITEYQEIFPRFRTLNQN
jgi:hypothetical protein